MSLWLCPEHGLYGGGFQCPRCGRTGEFQNWPTPNFVERRQPKSQEEPGK